MSAWEMKKFSIGGESMYDLDTYLGRCLHFARITDPRMINVDDKKLAEHKEKLQEFKKHPEKFDLSDQKVNKDLWYSKYCIKSAVNSETGKTLPLPFRMSAFLPMNIPISFGLMCLSPIKRNIFFFNFLNQSYNSSINYFNSSGSEDSLKYVTICYLLAVTSSIGTGFFLTNLFSKQKKLSFFKELLIRLLPSAIPGTLNILFMRSDYIVNGINIKDRENGQVIGTSKIAGLKALIESGFTRFFLPFPLVFFFLMIKWLGKIKMPKPLRILGEMSIVSVGLSVALPCSIALFKQNSSMRTKYLEGDLQSDPKIQKLNFIYYNKGL